MQALVRIAGRKRPVMIQTHPFPRIFPEVFLLKTLPVNDQAQHVRHGKGIINNPARIHIHVELVIRELTSHVLGKTGSQHHQFGVVIYRKIRSGNRNLRL